MRAEEFQGLGLEFTANLGLRVSQRVHIYYHYGTRSQKTITTVVWGDNSIMGVYKDPLGYRNE